MTDGFTDIVEQLERKKTAIDKALAALREVEGLTEVPPVRRRGRPPGTKNTRSLAVKKPRALSEEGRKSLAKNMRERWAVKRAAAKKAAKKAVKKASKNVA